MLSGSATPPSMARRPLVVVAVVLVAALTVLVGVGSRVLAHDRAELVAQFASARQRAIDEAAASMASEISDISDDLDLAANLLADSTDDDNILHSIATIKREYLVMHARTTAGASTAKVTAFDAPRGADAIVNATLEELLVRAEAEPGKLHASGPVAASGTAGAWYRVYARRGPRGPAVAVAIDTAILLARMKLARDPLARIVVLDGRGQPATLSDPALAALRPAQMLDAATAQRLGLPAVDAVVVTTPLVVDGGPPWTLLLAASTEPLQTQQATIMRRVLVGGGIVLVLVCAAAGYILYATFRARTLRERVKHEQRLLHSEKLVTAGQLAAGIAHEIGTPLSVARGRVELAMSRLGPEHTEAANHALVIDQIDRVTRLIQQLLDYVRPTPASVTEVDLVRSLRSVRELLAPQAAKRKVTLDVSGDEPAALRTDPDQVQQIVVNLALNAIDACEKGGRVDLRVEKRGLETILEVSDTGHGIPKELQKQVFDPFFTTKKRGQGTGLGLWVVAQLVQGQSGEIELASTPGTGTTVRVTWPGTP